MRANKDIDDLEDYIKEHQKGVSRTKKILEITIQEKTDFIKHLSQMLQEKEEYNLGKEEDVEDEHEGGQTGVEIMEPNTSQINHGATFICPICNIARQSENKIRNHMQVHDKKDEGLTDVPETNEEQNTQNKSESQWTIQGGQRIECPICGLTRNNKNQMEKHMKNHDDDEEDGMFTCTEECQYQTMNRDQLIEHLERKHEIYTCSKCKKSCNGNKELNLHIIEKHMSHKPCRNYATDSCEYRSECNFKHIKLKQNEHICYNCGVKTSALKDLMAHIKEAHGSEPCRKYAEGKCDRNTRCWYSHSRSTHNTSSPDFQVNHNRRRLHNPITKVQPAPLQVQQLPEEIQKQRIAKSSTQSDGRDFARHGEPNNTINATVKDLNKPNTNTLRKLKRQIPNIVFNKSSIYSVKI